MSAKIKALKPAIILILVFLIFNSPAPVFAVVLGSTSEGWNIYDPTSEQGTANYRYGPSMILNEDNSIDMWTCSPGSGDHVWDYIRYKHSSDNGVTWGPEIVALQPTAGSVDSKSTCDPGVVKFGGYYYMAYTSTLNVFGMDNDIFVARATMPEGPYEKWNGSGWGGNPQPFIEFDDALIDTYGAGEPSLVVKDDTLYIYYTWMSRDPVTGKPNHQTRLLTASTTDANWPGNTVYRGIAIERGAEGEDSTDHKYVPSMGKFIALSTAKRFGPFSYLKLYESVDGLHYTPATLPKNYINTFAHNAGITGNERGHFITTQNNRVAYAYGTNWGYWYTSMNPISLVDSGLPAIPTIRAVLTGNESVKLYFNTTGIAGETYTIQYGTSSGIYTETISGITGSPYTITNLKNGVPYFFTIAANNANGESGMSAQVSAVPLRISDAPRVAAMVSSELVGWEASNLIDASENTTWSSVGHSTNANTEWATIDTGENRMVQRVTLTARQPAEFGYPGKFKIQVSVDNTYWQDAVYDVRQYRLESPARNVYEFNEPLYGRYVRVLASELGHDENQPRNFYMQLADIKIEEIPYEAVASSSLSGWNASSILDNNSETSWSSDAHSTAAHTEWIALYTGAPIQVSSVQITPRKNGLGFPKDFKFQTSQNGMNWIDIPGSSYTEYPNPGSYAQHFKFSNTVEAQYIRMIATKLGADEFNNYYMQISDMKADTLVSRAPFASSFLPGWEVEKAADSQLDTYWSSMFHTSSAHTEWLAVDMGSQRNWSGIRLTPRPQYGFPVDFTLQSSNDGLNWVNIPGQTYKSYYNPGSTTQLFSFSETVSARYFRVHATKLSPDESGNYYLQLGEVIVDR